MRSVFLFVLLFLSSSFGFAQIEEDKYEYDGKILYSVKYLPTFKDFPVPEDDYATKRAEDIDFESSKGAWSFRTRLRRALKEGPNFAGKYAVMTAGCGTSCQGNRIIDTETGKIVAGLSSSLGLQYRKDSSLIIQHPPHEKVLDYDYTNQGVYNSMAFYILKKDEITGEPKLQEILRVYPPTLEYDDPKMPTWDRYELWREDERRK
jgi:hypothetical protein